MSMAMMHGGGGMMESGAGGTVLVVVLVLLAVAAGAAVMWIARGRRTVEGRSETSGGRAELDRRYATGELSRDEYLQRRQDIES